MEGERSRLKGTRGRRRRRRSWRSRRKDSLGLFIKTSYGTKIEGTKKKRKKGWTDPVPGVGTRIDGGEGRGRGCGA